MDSRGRARALLANLALGLGSLLVLAPLAGEILLRTGIALGVAGLRDPARYADPYSDDDYWKLNHRWGHRDNQARAGSVHPSLGWAPPRTRANPLGITATTPYEPSSPAGTILFFGDSFVQGVGAIEERLPQQLDALLPERRVLNYGVGGYGVDQILLRFRETHPLFERPTALVGVLTMDLDRGLLRVRTGQKPYFVLEEGELELRGLPIDPDPEAWIAAHPPGFRSYLGAFLARRVRLSRGGGDGTELPYRRDEKQALNRRILEEIAAEAERHGLPLRFVLFYNKHDLKKTGWREVFLREQMESLGVPHLDAKEVLLEAARREGRPLDAFFRRTDPHMNACGNRVVAEALAPELRLPAQPGP